MNGYFFLNGGNWHYGTGAGFFCTDVDGMRSIQNANIGIRPAFSIPRKEFIPMELKEMFTKYEELLAKKDELAQATKDNNALIDTLKEEIENEMVDQDIPQIAVGNYTYSLQEKTKYAKIGDEKLQAKGLDFYDVLRSQGYGDIIKETVNANTLNSTMSQAAEENGGELPEELAEIVSSYDYTDISRRKATNKAAKKVREKKGE